jgi:ABC-type Fe3+/spermidine/putrescine transport system ATPase subunit
VDEVDLQVNEEFFVLLGLSGSGKTTPRCVAGLKGRKPKVLGT